MPNFKQILDFFIKILNKKVLYRFVRKFSTLNIFHFPFICSVNFIIKHYFIILVCFCLLYDRNKNKCKQKYIINTLYHFSKTCLLISKQNSNYNVNLKAESY